MATPVTRDVLQRRMRKLAVDTIRLTGELPRTRAADVIGRQVVRSATSVAANYRSACRARSRRDFIAKMGIVEEEADETAFWLDLLDECGLAPATRDRKSTRLNSSHSQISYAVFCLKKKKQKVSLKEKQMT